MRFLNEPIFNAASQVTGNSSPVDCSYVLNMSAQAYFSDAAAAGTLKFQASNDPLSTTGGPVHWSDITGATVTVAAGATSIILQFNVCYQWIRAVWTSTGGAGTFTVNLKTNGL